MQLAWSLCSVVEGGLWLQRVAADPLQAPVARGFAEKARRISNVLKFAVCKGASAGGGLSSCRHAVDLLNRLRFAGRMQAAARTTRVRYGQRCTKYLAILQGTFQTMSPNVRTVCMDAARLGGRGTPSNDFYLSLLGAGCFGPPAVPFFGPTKTAARRIKPPIKRPPRAD